MSHLEIIDAIDSENNVIGQIIKEQSYKHKISHRVVHVMVLWGKKIFIPRRALTVRYLPGYYCSSAGGHVQAGETSLEGALRELKEEIGLNGPIELVNSFFYTHEFSVHTSLYVKRYDPKFDSIKFDPEEVLSGLFYSVEEIACLDEKFFHPQLAQCLRDIKGYL